MDEQLQEGDVIQPQKILMVNTKNLIHEPFESTMDVKVSNGKQLTVLQMCCPRLSRLN